MELIITKRSIIANRKRIATKGNKREHIRNYYSRTGNAEIACVVVTAKGKAFFDYFF